jgi:S1-C subfamily serine protease
MNIRSRLLTIAAVTLVLPPLHAQDSSALELVRADEQQRVEAFARAAKYVVCVFGADPASGGGSGVIIDPRGFGLTNFHVVASMLDTRKGFGGLNDGKLYPLTVLGIDPGGDTAMFKLEGRERFDYAPPADSDNVVLGQRVAAMGNPFILAEDYTPSISMGIVSGLHRYQEGAGEGNLLEYADCIQVSSSINPGNSGGPLFDMQGRLIGINGRGSFEERGRVNVGIGYAITINQVRRFMPALRAGRLCEHGTLGATVQSVGGEVIFNALQENAPADRAGAKLGEVLLAIDNRPMRTPNDFNNAIAILPANWPVLLSVRRGGGPQLLSARLERLPARLQAPWVPDADAVHAEVRRLFAGFKDFMGASAPFEDILDWTAELRDSKGERPSQSLSGRLERGAKAAVRTAVSAEWEDICGPLLQPAEISFGWDALGGDLVSGRLSAIVVRRPEIGSHVRWFFDWETGALLQACVGGADEPCQSVWTPAAALEEKSFSRKWQRHTSAGDELFELKSLVAVSPSASQPAEPTP